MDPIPSFGALCVLAELSSILCANSLPWQEFCSRAYRLRYIRRRESGVRRGTRGGKPECFRTALSGDACRLVLVLLQWIAELFPLIEAPEQGTDAIDSVLPELHRHLGSCGFAGTGAVQDHVAVARDLPAAQHQGLG